VIHGYIEKHFVFVGSGAGICFTTQLVAVALNFEKMRNVATGLAVSGASIGGFILTPLIQMTLDKYGDEGYYFILSGIMLNISVFGSLCFPSYLEEHVKLLKTKTKNLASSRSDKCLNFFMILKIPSFVSLCVSLFCLDFGTSIMFIYLPSYSVSTNNSPLEAAFLMSMCGLFGGISRFLAGLSTNGDDIDEIIIYCGTIALLGIATILFPLYCDTYSGQIAYSVVLGLYSGCCYVMLNTMTAKSVGLSNVTTGIGTEMVFCGFGNGLGSYLAGIKNIQM